MATSVTINGQSFLVPDNGDTNWGDYANQTIVALANNSLYPSDVVNDVTTGGTEVPLSAEQGKTLNTNKADRVSGATLNNIATLETDGDAKDSGKEFDTDGTMAADSDDRIPTQKAIVAYVANNSGSGDSMLKQNETIDSGLSGVNPVYKNVTKDIIDPVLSADWTDSADVGSSLNTTTFKYVTSLNITKDAGTTTAAFVTKTFNAADQKELSTNTLKLWLYIKDTTALNKLATSNAFIVHYGNDNSNYYVWNTDKASLVVGWQVFELTEAGKSSETGTVTDNALDYMYIGFTAANAANTWSDGDFMVDYIYIESDVEWKGCSNTTPTPEGISMGDNDDTVVFAGYSNLFSGLIPNKQYYMDSSGNATLIEAEAYNQNKLWWSISETEAIIDIQVEGSNVSQGDELVFIGAVKGYTFGGITATNTVDDIVFSTDAISPLAATFAANRGNQFSVWNKSRSYIIGGYTGAAYGTQIYYFQYSNEAAGDTGETIAADRDKGGEGMSEVAGYMMGGWNGSIHNDIYKLVFSTETDSTLGDTLTTSKTNCASTSINSKCYQFGGDNGAGTYYNKIGKFTFSDENEQEIGETLDDDLTGFNAGSSEIKAYIFGGFDGTRRSYIDDFVYSTETATRLAATLSGTIGVMYQAVVSSRSNSWLLGGRDAAGNATGGTSGDNAKFVHSTETIGTISDTLRSNLEQPARGCF